MARRKTIEKQPELIPDLDPPVEKAKKTRRLTVAPDTPKQIGTNVVQLQAPKTFLELAYMAARDKSVDVNKFERLLGIQRDQEKAEAERVFGEAMLRVQDQIPPITKDGKGDRNIRYVKLETIVKRIGRVSRHEGFSQSWSTEESPLPGHYREICFLAHKGGHTRKYQIDVPTDDVGLKGERNKTATHGMGSSMSYGRRYLTIMMFNVVVQDEDDDGTHDLAAKVTEEQLKNLVDTCTTVGADRKLFERHLGCQLTALPVDRYDEAMGALNAYAERKAELKRQRETRR